jgi:hypothetical protein
VLAAAAAVLLAGAVVLLAGVCVAAFGADELLCELPHPASASAAPASGATGRNFLKGVSDAEDLDGRRRAKT